MKLGLFTPAWPGHNTPNGIATAVYNLAMGLRANGHMPIIITMAIDGEAPTEIPVIEVSEKRWSFLEKMRARFGDYSVIERKFIQRISDAVETAKTEHQLTILVMEESEGWARLVQSKTGIPTVLMLHGPSALLRKSTSRAHDKPSRYQLRKEAQERRAFMEAAGIMSPSRHVLKDVEEMAPLGDIPRAVFPNAYQAERPVPVAASQNPPRILFVGRFDYLKGGDTILEAFAQLVEQHPTAHLTFAGPDNGLAQSDGSVLKMEQALAPFSEEMRANFTFLGSVSREKVAELRRQHAIALVASRYENLNYSLLEAMAAGQAIVSTSVGGPAEVLLHEDTALLVPAGDATEMAMALGRLLEDRALTERLGCAAVEKVQRDFSPAAVAGQMVSFLEEQVLKRAARFK